MTRKHKIRKLTREATECNYSYSWSFTNWQKLKLSILLLTVPIYTSSSFSISIFFNSPQRQHIDAILAEIILYQYSNSLCIICVFFSRAQIPTS